VAILPPAAAAGIRDWADCALNLFFPHPESSATPPKPIVAPFCRKCGYPYEHAPDLPFECSTCADRTWHFEWARAGYWTDGQVLEAVAGFKYHEQFFRLSQLTRWLTHAFDQHAAAVHWDALVPVPLYHRRRRERGFNQARELARELGRARRLPVRDCLRRRRETPSQVGLRRGARWENMRNAFDLKGGFDVAGQNLLLIDDVFTTGATTNACARVLAAAGAGRLAVLTVSRS
jgi:ComF family protein